MVELISLLVLSTYYVFIREEQAKKEIVLDPIENLARRYDYYTGRVLFCISMGLFTGIFLLFFIVLIDFFY